MNNNTTDTLRGTEEAKRAWACINCSKCSKSIGVGRKLMAMGHVSYDKLVTDALAMREGCPEYKRSVELARHEHEVKQDAKDLRDAEAGYNSASPYTNGGGAWQDNSDSDAPHDSTVREDHIPGFNAAIVKCLYASGKYRTKMQKKREYANSRAWCDFVRAYLFGDKDNKDKAGNWKLKCDGADLKAMVIDSLSVQFPSTTKLKVDTIASMKHESLRWLPMLPEFYPWLDKRKDDSISHAPSFWVAFTLAKIIDSRIGANVEFKQDIIDTLANAKKYTVASWIYFIGVKKLDWNTSEEKDRIAETKERELIAEGKEDVSAWIENFKNEYNGEYECDDDAYGTDIDRYADDIVNANDTRKDVNLLTNL